MKPHTLLLAASILAGFPFLAHAKIERVVEKSFTVAPGGLLKVETQGGDIQVTPGLGNDVKVVAKEHFRADSEKEADEIAQHLSLQIEQAGSDISAVAKYDGQKKGWFSGGRGALVEVEFVVTVPTQYRARLRTSGGNIHVGDLTGDVDLRTSGGNIILGKIDGAVDVETSGGNIAIEEAVRNVKAHTSGGDVQVKKVVGEARLSTSGGNIRVDAASGSVHADTSGGDVTARFVDTIPSDCSLETSGGNVKVQVTVPLQPLSSMRAPPAERFAFPV